MGALNCEAGIWFHSNATHGFLITLQYHGHFFSYFDLCSGDTLAVRIPVLIEATYNHVEPHITHINMYIWSYISW